MTTSNHIYPVNSIALIISNFVCFRAMESPKAYNLIYGKPYLLVLVRWTLTLFETQPLLTIQQKLATSEMCMNLWKKTPSYSPWPRVKYLHSPWYLTRYSTRGRGRVTRPRFFNFLIHLWLSLGYKALILTSSRTPLRRYLILSHYLEAWNQLQQSWKWCKSVLFYPRTLIPLAWCVTYKAKTFSEDSQEV